MNDKRISFCWYLLKITYGLLFVVAGLDKFFNIITTWSKYVSKEVLDIIPLELKTFILIVGIFEIALGLLILLSKWTKMAAWIASAWLIIIALNLVALKIYYDIAVRDVVMAIGAIVLSILTCVVRTKD